MPEKFDDSEVTLMLAISTASFLFLSGIMIAILLIFQKKKFRHYQKIIEMETAFQDQLMQSRIEVQEQTSTTLSKELHDNVGQLLTTTKMLIGLSERELTYIPDTIKTAQETLGKAINELRTLSKSLDKDWLSQFNFLENLDQEAARINAAHSVQIQVLKPINNKLLLNADKQIILFRIVQESLQNAIKHAGASTINIDIKNINNTLLLSIKDNGNGFSETAIKNNGMGLANMKHRAQILGGTFNIESQKEKGTCIKIELPITENII